MLALPTWSLMGVPFPVQKSQRPGPLLSTFPTLPSHVVLPAVSALGVPWQLRFLVRASDLEGRFLSLLRFLVRASYCVHEGALVAVPADLRRIRHRLRGVQLLRCLVRASSLELCIPSCTEVPRTGLALRALCVMHVVVCFATAGWFVAELPVGTYLVVLRLTTLDALLHRAW